VPERSYRWKRNKQLIFLAAYLLILVGAIWLLSQQYPTAADLHTARPSSNLRQGCPAVGSRGLSSLAIRPAHPHGLNCLASRGLRRPEPWVRNSAASVAED
jgi:hypothetical protein